MPLTAKARSQFRASLAIDALLSFASLQLNAGETIVNNASGFTLTLPDGFKPNLALVGKSPDIIDAFVSDDPNDDELGIILFIQQLQRPIGRERFKRE